MRHRRPTRAGRAGVALVAVVVAAVVTAGCGGDDDASDDDDAAPASTSTSAAITTTTAADEDGLAGEGTGVLDELAQTLLIQAAELGDASFADAGYSPGAALGAVWRPRRGPGTRRPGRDRARLGVDGDDGDRGAPGLRLARGRRRRPLPPPPALCTAGTDVAAQVGADRALAFAGESTYVVALVADTVLAFHVTGTAVDPLEAAAFGTGKVLAALEN